MTIEINGEYTTAKVYLDDLEGDAYDQIEEMVNHEAFTQPIRVMPDVHPGAGCVIGFSMPITPKVIPNIIGVDIGCGMYAVKLSDFPEKSLRKIDEGIRDVVPMGYKGHDDQQYHIAHDFPWDDCEEKFFNLAGGLYRDYGIDVFKDDWYDIDYFNDLCERVEVKPYKAIVQMGTLGGGNHFIELSESSETGDTWVVIHSGSRAIGLAVAQYWQQRATDERSEAGLTPIEYDELPDEVKAVGANLEALTGDDGRIDMQKAAVFCREHYEGPDIEANINRLRQVRYDRGQGLEDNRNTDLDYLEGESAFGYLVDMVFAQTYAWENRRYMAKLIAEELGVEIVDEIHSPHNLIDFGDLVIRKGSTRAHEGERFIVPMNMAEGVMVLEGKGNEDWNRSAPHGLGRPGSRTWAKKTFTMQQYQNAMAGVYSSSINPNTLDESPMAYKNSNIVTDRIGETGDIVDHLTPVMNLKADW